MRTRAVATPVWVKALLILVGVGVPTWWLADRHDRITNQHRLEAIASEIAGRHVEVRCPGPLGRLFGGWDTVEGSVRFDADGAPRTRRSCARPPARSSTRVAEGRRDAELGCVERSLDCGERAIAVARAVDVVTHEAFHLQGIIDEAETECHSVQTMGWTAERLGATEAQGRALARLQFATGFPLMPARYQKGDCTVP